MSSRYNADNVELVKRMRILEKELSEVHLRIRLHEGIYQQSSYRVETMRALYKEHHGEQYAELIEGDPDFRRALEKMNVAKRQLQILAKEQEKLSKRVQDLMFGP